MTKNSKIVRNESCFSCYISSMYVLNTSSSIMMQYIGGMIFVLKIQLENQLSLLRDQVHCMSDSKCYIFPKHHSFLEKLYQVAASAL